MRMIMTNKKMGQAIDKNQMTDLKVARFSK